MYFNIYYLNFDKVFEISMMINNKIPTSEEQEEGSEESTQVKAGVMAAITGIFKASAEINENGMNNENLKKTMEIKTTNSLILNQVIEKSKAINTFSTLREGDLIKINDVSLSLYDEEEVRQIKLFTQGILDGIKHEGVEVSNMVKSLIKDYSYYIKGKKGRNNIIIKIPSEIGNEFESMYNIDDILIGKVSLVGIYKGVRNVNDFKSTFSYIKGQKPTEVNDKTKIKDSSSTVGDKTGEKKLSKERYHFVDILAIIQEVSF